jgi:hypothetical protein
MLHEFQKPWIQRVIRDLSQGFSLSLLLGLVLSPNLSLARGLVICFIASTTHCISLMALPQCDVVLFYQ